MWILNNKVLVFFSYSEWRCQIFITTKEIEVHALFEIHKTKFYSLWFKLKMLTKYLYMSSIPMYHWTAWNLLLGVVQAYKINTHEILLTVFFSWNQFSSNLFVLFQIIEYNYPSQKPLFASPLMSNKPQVLTILLFTLLRMSPPVNNTDPLIQRLIIACQYYSVGFKRLSMFCLITSKCHVMKCVQINIESAHTLTYTHTQFLDFQL